MRQPVKPTGSLTTPTSTRKRLTALLLILSVQLGSVATSSTSYAHDPTGDIARAVELATQANEDAKEAIKEAREAKQREEDAKKQRDDYRAQLETCQTDRDHAAKGEADCKNRNLDLEAKVAPLVVENTLLQADLEKQKRLTKVWTVGALIAGVLLGAAAGGYVGVKAAK